MRKLRLDLDALRVETFAPAADPAAGSGTVHGMSGYYECTISGDVGGCNSGTGVCCAANTAEGGGTTCYNTGNQIVCMPSRPPECSETGMYYSCGGTCVWNGCDPTQWVGNNGQVC
jgi:hypothetical protein